MALPSERVVLSSPLSFTGSATRIWRAMVRGPRWAKALAGTAAVLTIGAVWTMVTVVYLLDVTVLGLWLFPVRLLRRHQRRQRRDALRHRELIHAIEQSGRRPGDAA